MDYLEYKAYKGTVEYSKADNCLFGKVIGLGNALITYQGDTIDELRKDFEDGVESYINGCAAEGIEPQRSYGGKLTITVTPEEHSRIAQKARNAGLSVSSFVRKALASLL